MTEPRIHPNKLFGRIRGFEKGNLPEYVTYWMGDIWVATIRGVCLICNIVKLFKNQNDIYTYKIENNIKDDKNELLGR